MPSPDRSPVQRIVVVTGMNGAGKTTALKAFEDLGYEAVDNLPLSLLERLVHTEDDRAAIRPDRPLAIGVDSRTRAFSADSFLAQVLSLRGRAGFDVTLLFFDCSDEDLAQRFSETRRRHPLAIDRPVADGIAREREIMAPIRARADEMFDTSGQTVHDLKRWITTRFALATEDSLALTVMSFGFGRGLPRDADLVFDVRFLRNPNYVPELKAESGKSEAVAAYVAGDEQFGRFFERLKDLVTFLLPLYEREGKSYLTVAVGCTGGRHRSVFIAELLGRVLAEAGYPASIRHRDIEANKSGPAPEARREDEGEILS